MQKNKYYNLLNYYSNGTWESTIISQKGKQRRLNVLIVFSLYTLPLVGILRYKVDLQCLEDMEELGDLDLDIDDYI